MRNYLNLEIRHTMQNDNTGKRYKLLGLFAVMGPYLMNTENNTTFHWKILSSNPTRK